MKRWPLETIYVPTSLEVWTGALSMTDDGISCVDIGPFHRGLLLWSWDSDLYRTSREGFSLAELSLLLWCLWRSKADTNDNGCRDSSQNGRRFRSARRSDNNCILAFLGPPMVRLILIWKVDSSKKTQFDIKSIPVLHHWCTQSYHFWVGRSPIHARRNQHLVLPQGHKPGSGSREETFCRRAWNFASCMGKNCLTLFKLIENSQKDIYDGCCSDILSRSEECSRSLLINPCPIAYKRFVRRCDHYMTYPPSDI